MQSKFLAAFILPVFFAGCAPKPDLTPLNTPSGKPEVTIKGKSQQEVIEGIISFCAETGAMLDDQTTSTVVCSNDAGGFKANFMFGTQHGALRIVNRWFVTKAGQDGMRVQIISAYYENMNAYGGVQKYPQDVTRGVGAKQLQTMVEEFATSITKGE